MVKNDHALHFGLGVPPSRKRSSPTCPRAGCLIDSAGIFVVGLSNGGYVAHRVGNEQSTTVAAGRSLFSDAVDRVVNRAFDAVAGDGFQ